MEDSVRELGDNETMWIHCKDFMMLSKEQLEEVKKSHTQWVKKLNDPTGSM